jgi:AraC-like DNA-binding protein
MRDDANPRLPAATVVRSCDMDEVHRSATTVMNTHHMRVLRRAQGAQAEINQSDSGRLKILHFAYRSEVEIRPEPLVDFIAVHLPVRGTLAYSCNGHDYRVGPRSGVAISPRDDVWMRWSEDLELQVLRVDLAAVEGRLEALTGAKPARALSFDPVLDERRAGMLSHVVDAARLLIDAPTTRASALLAWEFEELVTSSLLLDLPHSYSDWLGGMLGAAPAHTARIVADYCREHYAEPLSVADLAAAAHVSERTLFAAFRREFGTTPGRWLRDLRLERARDALQSRAEATGVAAVALDHGFGHVGRFAADYQRAFGEWPSDTLRRARAH